jgi:ATP-dependent exoDNAse (exonuclease V) beta subunit
MGSILHEVFSTIRTTADIDEALRRLELEGVIYEENLTHDKIASMIRRRLDDPRVARWFSDRWRLFNECTILSTDTRTGAVYERRPDRVMTDGDETVVVDFKFGHPRDEYRDQVREYMQLLTQMGHHRVTGYLWYVYSNQIVEITEN